MTSRRSFITGLGALFIAAPAIVRASSLMPVKAISDGISLRKIAVYDVGADESITRLHVLFGSMQVRPEWTALELPPELVLDEYSARIIKPMQDKFAESVAKSIMARQDAAFDLAYYEGQQWPSAAA
jgi:hypothetical protein